MNNDNFDIEDAKFIVTWENGYPVNVRVEEKEDE